MWEEEIEAEMAHLGLGGPSSRDRPSSYSSGSRGRGAIPRRSDYRNIRVIRSALRFVRAPFQDSCAYLRAVT